MKVTSTILLSALAIVASGSLAIAQDANNQGGQNGGRRGNFNIEEFRQRMNERLKTSLKASDEEWAVIQPLVEKVQTKQREAGSGRFGGFGRGPGGPGGPGGDRGGNATGGTQGGDQQRNRGGSPESQALRDTLEKDGASADEIKAKLTALRDSRKKAQAELEQSREELRKVLTVRQEAALVAMGILE